MNAIKIHEAKTHPPALLDTHVLLLWFDNPHRLSSEARTLIGTAANAIFVSSVSTWEIIIKKSLGKLRIPDHIFTLITEEHFIELPVTIAHTRALEKLPAHHADPFDRLLIGQAKHEHMTMITRDAVFAQYGIPLIRA